MNGKQRKPRIAVTLGESAGIGPEIVLKALQQPAVRDVCQPLIVGDMRIVQRAADEFHIETEFRRADGIDSISWSDDTVAVLDQRNLSLEDFEDGKPNAATGRAMIEDTKAAVQLALDGYVEGAVGAPHSKKAAEDGGYHFTGYPMLIAEMTGDKFPFLLLVADSLRVANVTLHISVRKAVDLIKKDLILECIKATDTAVRTFGIPQPKIAVAGLNPHAGEERLFGCEDEDEIKPAVSEARSLNIDAYGPLPADSLFHGCQDGKYDAYVAMYHDQAHIPVKVVAFKRASAVAIGVPVNWATVDHGCALDIAWKGIADPAVLAYTIELVSNRAVAGAQIP